MTDRATRTVDRLQARIQQLENQLANCQMQLETVRASEAKFRAIVEYANDSVATLSYAGKVTYLSPNVQRTIGYSPTEVVGQPFAAFIHPDDLPHMSLVVAQVMATAQPYVGLEYRVLHKQGHYVWHCANLSVYQDEAGQPVLIAIGRDATQQKATEAALAKSQAQFEAILQNANVAIFAKDLEGRYIFANQWVAEEVGIPIAQILGKTDAELLPLEVAEMLQANDRLALETGRALRLEEIIATPEGDRAYLAIKFPLQDPAGEPYAICGISTNITDLKRTEAALRKSESRLNRILDRTFGCIGDYRVYSDRRFIADYFSSGSVQLWGFTPEELLADLQLYISRYEPEDLQVIIEESFDCIFSERPYKYEYRYHHPDGSLRWIELNLNSYRDEAEDCWRTTVISIDITDRKRAEEALRESEAKLNQILDRTTACIADFRVYPDRRFIGTYFSPGSVQLWGLTPEEMLTDLQPWLDRYHPQDLANNLAACFDYIFNERPYTYEYRYHHPNGSLRWIQLNVTSYWEETEGCWRTPTVSIDITDRKRLEEELRQSEYKFRAIVENANDMIYLIKPDGTFAYMSPNVSLNLGYTVSELQGQSFAPLVHPDDLEATLSSFQDVLNGQSIVVEARAFHKDGSLRWFSCQVSPFRDTNGDLFQLGIARNITEQKRLEEELRQSEAKFRAIVENASDLIATVDADGILTYLSPVAIDFFGYEVSELIGTSFIPLIHPDDLPLCTAAVQQGLAEGRATIPDYRMVHRDGSTRYFTTLVSRFEDENSNPVVLGITRDITDRKRLEEELRQSEYKFRAIVENANDLIYIVDQNGSIVYMSPNSAAVQGYSPEEMEGRTFDQFVHPDDLAAAADAVQRSIAGEQFSFEIRSFNKDGKIAWFDSNVVPFQLPNGEMALMGISRDTTDRRQAEEALRRSERKYRNIFENSYVGVGRARLNDASILEVNQRLAEMLGFDHPSEVIGQSWRQFCGSEADAQRFAAILQDQGFMNDEVQVRLRDGSVRWWLTSNRVNFDEDCLDFIVVDISDRRQAEAALQRSEILFRSIFEQSAVAIGLSQPDGTVMIANSAAAEMLGYSEAELKQITFRDHTHPDDLDLDLALYQELLDGKRDSYLLEKRYLRKDRQIIWVRITISAIYDEQGRVALISAVSEDISDRKRLEEDLRQSQQFLNSIIENIPLGFFAKDIRNDFRYVLINKGAEKFVCFSREEGIGHHDYELLPQAQADFYYQQDQLVVQRRSLVEIPEVEILTPDNEQIFARILKLPLFDDRGNLTHLLCLTDDITELKQREAELRLARDAAEAANRAKSTFLANMSHELRTPLNVILGFTQLIDRENALSDRQRSFLNTINRSGEHLLNLINDVLEMSKIEAGRITLNPEPFDLHHLLGTLQEMFRVRAEAKRLSLTFHLPSDLPGAIVADEGKLRQVLINLLSNAVKFTEQGSITLKVALRTAERGSGGAGEQGAGSEIPPSHPTPDAPPLLHPSTLSPTLTFTLADTGIGIAPEEIEQLFQPFVQTASGLRIKEGTGLGLTISRQFVQLMGGDIQLQSVLGQGSRFIVQIPVMLTQVAVVAAPVRQQKVLGLMPGQPTYRLLIVDDRLDNCNLLTHLLQSIGFETRIACNGQEAIEQWQTWQPHLIWMDIRMPVMDGYEATRRIRALEKSVHPSTKIIALTASAFEEQRTTILAAGCDDFVRKPFREQVLFDKLTEHLGVQFRYADRPTDNRAIEDDRPFSVRVADMPPEWIRELQQAAIELDDDRLLQLVAEIPPQGAKLAEQLSLLINRFCFDEILELIAGETDE